MILQLLKCKIVSSCSFYSMKRCCIIVGSLTRIAVSAVQTAVHRGKRKMRGLASNRKTAMRTHSGQSRACWDNKGWDKVYAIKKM